MGTDHFPGLPMRLLLPLLLACNPKPDPDDTGVDNIPDPPGELVGSSLDRITDPDVDEATLLAHTASMRGFAFDLLHEAAGDENFFSSPLSISVALAMTYAGAEGATESQMASALHFDLPEPDLHAAFNALDLELEGRADEVDAEEGGVPFRLSIVNQLFGQTGFPFLDPFLDTLALNYGAGLRLLDFAADPDGNRVLINDWVMEATEDRIVDLLPEGSITDLTRLVLVNAIYFKASWSVPFEASDTTDDSFTTLAGSVVTVPTMHGTVETLYGSGEGYAVVDLPFVGEQLALTLLVPDAGRFVEVRDALDEVGWDAALDGMATYNVALAAPRFGFSSQLDVVPPLQALGMTDAFEMGLADLTGMNTESELYIGGIYHQAFIAVDEVGAEAAAATAVVVNDESAPEPAALTVDRPFLFAIRDRPTGTVLFLGQVVDPS